MRNPEKKKLQQSSEPKQKSDGECNPIMANMFKIAQAFFFPTSDEFGSYITSDNLGESMGKGPILLL